MRLSLSALPDPFASPPPVELVERKGRGHPDTICDALAEELSLALSRWYVERFGCVLSHNVDKVMLAAGAARPAFGGGVVTAPFRLHFAGRACTELGGVAVPLDDIVHDTARSWLRLNLRHVDVDRHVEIRSLLRPCPVDRLDLFRREQHTGPLLATDTSCGIGHAPCSLAERIVLEVETHLNSPLVHERCPFAGEDVKVQGLRRGRDITLTVACAQVDAFVPDLDGYRDHVAALAAEVQRAAQAAAGTAPLGHLEVVINAGDDLVRGLVYLTVTGTSAEAGDDGATGRGNRVGGLITPMRAMSLDSAAGKNPLQHTGKLYNVVAHQIARDLVAELPALASAECLLVGRIGQPLYDPQLVHLGLATRDGSPVERLRDAVSAIVRTHLDRVDSTWQVLSSHAVPLY
jgi:S-adenosylmethionine synthetase